VRATSWSSNAVTWPALAADRKCAPSRGATGAAASRPLGPLGRFTPWEGAIGDVALCIRGGRRGCQRGPYRAPRAVCVCRCAQLPFSSLPSAFWSASLCEAFSNSESSNRAMKSGGEELTRVSLCPPYPRTITIPRSTRIKPCSGSLLRARPLPASIR
jgi:hypothetical protein